MLKTVALDAILLLALAASHPASAASIRFGNVETKSGVKINLTNRSTYMELTAASTAVIFTYKDLFGTPLFPSLGNDMPVAATFTLQAQSSTPAVLDAEHNQYTMGGFTGYFDISFSKAVADLYYGGRQVLLHGVFNTSDSAAATLNVNSPAGSTGGIQASAGTMRYTSDFISFQDSTLQSFTWSLGFTEGVHSSGDLLTSDTATLTGSFSSDPGPRGTGTPEPATLGLIGSALIALGFAVRRRQVIRPGVRTARG